MNATNVARPAAVLAGLSSIALGVVTLTGPAVPDEHWGTRGALVNALGLVTFAALAVALELLPDLLSLRRLGRAGCRVAQAGLVAMTVESIASQAHSGNTLGPVFLLGLLAALVGLLLVGVDGLRRGRPLAVVPFVGLLVAIAAGAYGGFVLLGLVWVGAAAWDARVALRIRPTTAPGPWPVPRRGGGPR